MKNQCGSHGKTPPLPPSHCGRLAHRRQRFTLLSLEVKLRSLILCSSLKICALRGHCPPPVSVDPWHHPPMAETPSSTLNSLPPRLPCRALQATGAHTSCDNENSVFTSSKYLPIFCHPHSSGPFPGGSSLCFAQVPAQMRARPGTHGFPILGKERG